MKIKQNSLKIYKKQQPVYCMTVEDNHNFFIVDNDKYLCVKNCAGWNIRTLLEEGFGGVENKINSGPAKHLISAMQQIVNFLGVLQNCWAGNTPIMFADGTIKTFLECEKENITEGKVIGFNPITKTYGEYQAKDIGKRSENSPLVEIEFEDGTKRCCEPWHMLLTSNRGYVEAQELSDKDNIVGLNELLKIKSVKKTESGPVYCMVTEEVHNFAIALNNSKKGFITSQCWAGAQAFSSFDTYLAPFIRKDNMTDAEIKQAMQQFCWGINTSFVLSNGKSISFKEAYEQNITEAEVLSYDENNKQIVTAQATNIGKRIENSEMIRIWFDDVNSQECDPEQQLLTKNRGWVMAKNLTEEDDLLEFDVLNS